MPRPLAIATVVLLSLVTFANATVNVIPNAHVLTQSPGTGKITTICTVTGEQFVGWYGPKGDKITTDSSKDTHVTVSGVKARLVLIKPDINDCGAYTCKGSKNSAPFTMYSLIFSLPAGDDQVLQRSQTGVIKVDVQGYPQPIFIWKKDSVNVGTQGRFSVKTDGSLEIKNVQESDQGNYTLDSSIADGMVEISKEMSVKVYETARITKQPKKDRYATVGFNITFECVATGFPSVKYTWKNPIDQTIQTFDRFRVDGGVLTIDNLQPGDKGTYTCEVTSGDGNIARASSKLVDIFEKPVLKLYPDANQNVALKDELRLECKVTGGTSPVNVRWMKDGKEYEEQRKVLGSDETVIFIKKVRNIDSGLYACEATNGAQDGDGNVVIVRESIRVNAISPPVANTIRTPSIIYSFIGNELPTNIRCSFYGYPYPWILMYDTETGWLVSNGTQEANYKVYTDKKESVRYFRTYRCLAKNKYGIRNSTVTLKHAEPPGEPRNMYVNVTCNSIGLYWHEPADDGGLPITEYVVGYGVERDDETMKSVDGQVFEFVIPRLVPELRYKYSVKAFNRAHHGVTAARGNILTAKYCRPSRPSIIEPESEMLDSNWLSLKWRPPKENGGDPEITYKVRYAPYLESGEFGSPVEIETTELQIDLMDLKERTMYRVEVVAVNRGGESEPSSRRYQVPGIGARQSHSGVVSASLPLMVATILLSAMVRHSF